MIQDAKERSGAACDLSAAELRAFRRKLLAWYGRNARELPWRADRDPYRVWVSEVMLQQTQVDTVRPYFERFLAAFPTVVHLAAASEQHVLKLWEGLGYYRRARGLHAAAKKIVEDHDGCVPDEESLLRALPGVGRYTAGAILSIAFDRPAPILEANTRRLYARLIGFTGDPTQKNGESLLWEVAEELLAKKDSSRLNQALMELGSLVCKPVTPDCESCPVANYCVACREGLVDQIPATKPRAKPTSVNEVAVVVRNRGRYLVRQCASDERWAGMWDFPRFEVESEMERQVREEVGEKILRMTGVRCDLGDRIQTIRHTVTRFRITLDCYEAQRIGGRLLPGCAWRRPAELEQTPLSVTGRRIAEQIGA